MEKNSLPIDELQETLFSLKVQESPAYGDINFNVVKILLEKLANV